jgi:DNA (cytosine-5)-methyltransferase 1
MDDVAAVRGTNGYKVVSTFSGCGGSCLGFEMAGFEVLWASEFIPAAQETYMANHPGVPLSPQDIREVEPALILERLGLERGELDVLEGSPPCASFSTAGKGSKGWGEVRNYSDGVKQRTDDLFFEFARFVEGLYPKVFVAENVSGMTKGHAVGYGRVILKRLRECGYDVTSALLNAMWLGVPQMRERLIFIGIRGDIVAETGIRAADAFPPALPYFYTLREALHLGARARFLSHSNRVPGERDADRPIPTVTADGGIGGHRGGAILNVMSRRHGTNLDDRSPDEPAPTITGTGMGGQALDYGQVEEVVETRVIHDTSGLWGKGDVTDEPAPTITVGVGGLNSEHFKVEERIVLQRGVAGRKDKSIDDPAPTVQAFGIGDVREYQAWIETDEDGLPLASPEEYAAATFEGKAIEAEWERTKLGKGSDKYLNLIRPDPDSPSPTATAAGGNSGAASVTHPTQRRKFTIDELKAVCGFPHDFVLIGTYRQQWERLGRAVPPVMMAHIAQSVRERVLDQL